MSRKLVATRTVGVYALIGTHLAFGALARTAASQDAPYVPTPPEVVRRMIEFAEVGPKDVVYDLGCGDGRIVIAAAKAGARGVCVELDAARLAESRRNAENSGVADRIRFIRGNLFDVSLSDATVVTLFLLGEQNMQLRPRLLRELKPGARVVSHAFDMGDWVPDERRVVALSSGESVLYRWTIREGHKDPRR